jgi:hypothetical protein
MDDIGGEGILRRSHCLRDSIRDRSALAHALGRSRHLRAAACPCWKSNPNGDRAAELGEQSPWRRLGRTPPHSRGSHWRAAFNCGSNDHASRPTSTPLAALQSSAAAAPSDGTRRKPRSQSPPEHHVHSNRRRFPPSLSNLLKRRETPWRRWRRGTPRNGKPSDPKATATGPRLPPRRPRQRRNNATLQPTRPGNYFPVRGRRGRRQRALPNHSIHRPEVRYQRGLATATRRSSRHPCNRRTFGPAAQPAAWVWAFSDEA